MRSCSGSWGNRFPLGCDLLACLGNRRKDRVRGLVPWSAGGGVDGAYVGRLLKPHGGACIVCSLIAPRVTDDSHKFSMRYDAAVNWHVLGNIEF